jgi:tRNA G18 (ribose-2'-O)-methylase SpoU
MPDIIVIAHNIRSTHNIGSIFRTCEGFGVSKLIISGYSPYPKTANDTRLPHISEKLTSQIHKTALGAETMVPFEYQAQLDINAIKSLGYTVVGLEQDENSVMINEFKTPTKTALLLGEEVNGLTEELRNGCDSLIEIPMQAKKSLSTSALQQASPCTH